MATKEDNEVNELISDWDRNLVALLDNLRINTFDLIAYLKMRGVTTLEDFYHEKPEKLERFLTPVQYEKLKTEFEDNQMKLACESLNICDQRRSVSDSERKSKAFPIMVALPTVKPNKDDMSFRYDMKPDRVGIVGKAVIIVNKDFGGSTREGAEKDRDNLMEMFENLHVDFTVHENRESGQMGNILRDFANSSFENSSIVFVAISTHGSENNSIQGTDGLSIKIDEVIDLFQKNEKLRGKPKIFLIQACRGTLVDFSSPHSSDNNESGMFESDALPVEQTFASNTSDVLIAYATSNKYKAWRDKTNGSWFITELKNTFENFPGYHLSDVLTICAHNVIRNYQIVNNGQVGTQACNYHSSLTKFVYF